MYGYIMEYIKFTVEYMSSTKQMHVHTYVYN